MSDLNNFYNNNSNDNNNNNNNDNSNINDFFNPSDNQELEIEDNRNLVDAPDTSYNKPINDNSNIINDNTRINTNTLPNAKLEREYNFDEETDKKTIIKNVILITIVVIVGFFLVYKYSGVQRNSSSSGENITPQEQASQQTIPSPQESPVAEDNETTTQIDEEMYLEVSASRPVSGSGIEQIGKDRFYKTDTNIEIDSNGVIFVIKKFTDKGVTIVLNTELRDTTSSVGCRKSICTEGSEITLDGKITVIFETLDKENKINYSFNVYNIKY